MICKWYDSTLHTFALPVVRSVCLTPFPPPNFSQPSGQYNRPERNREEWICKILGSKQSAFNEQGENGEFTEFLSIIFWPVILHLCCLLRLWKGPRRNRFELAMFPLLYLTELPGCLFELNYCAWEPSDNWRMSKLSPLKVLEEDWQNTLGTYIVPFCFNKPN